MATIIEDYCSKEIYRLLIEKGFDGEVHTTFDDEGYTQPSVSLQMAMKWLREVHHIHIRLINSSDESYRYEIYPREGKYRSSCFSDRRYYETYEKAAEAACIYALKYLI